MTDIAIRVEQIGKQYRIGAYRKNRNMREAIVDAAKAPFRRAGKLLRGQASGAAELDESIWALQDVSFEVNHGDVIGIIGKNGSGKSTLLKIISRITNRQQGLHKLCRPGRLVAGSWNRFSSRAYREGEYLSKRCNLGHEKRSNIGQFDEIVAFSEVEKFIDTPVKHYSSGMYLRLAFAVAAHLEPEILLVDEVLAVGDAAFQKKCLGKMSEVAKEGRTILFVSHNMAAIANLCSKAILLDQGKVRWKAKREKSSTDILPERLQWQKTNWLGEKTVKETGLSIIAAIRILNQIK